MTVHHALKLPGRFYRAYPPEQPLGYATDAVELGLHETMFLLVDVYGKGFDADQALGQADAFYTRAVEAARDTVITRILPAKQAAKAAGLPVIYLTNYLSPGLNHQHEWRNLSLRTLNIDVLEAWTEPNDALAFSEIIAPTAGEYLIKKQFYSGFFETHLDSLLRSLGARNLVTVGYDSRICLAATITDAMYRNYRVITLRDCIGTNEEAETKEGGWANFLAVRYIETNVGYTATAAEWIEACQALAGGD